MEKCPPLHLGLVAIGKGAFGSPSTTVDNFTFTIYIYILEFSIFINKKYSISVRDHI